MYEYKKIKGLLTECLEEMYGLGYRLAYYDKEVQISVWDKKITQTRKTPTKNETVEEKLYFSESFVKSCCDYYKDIEQLYFDWRKQRTSTGKFQPFTERSEKIVWNKIQQFPKPIVIEMLNNAIQGSWGRLIDLQQAEKDKVMLPYREARRIEQAKETGFKDEEEKQKAELEKARIEEVIKNNPQLEIEARNHVLDKFPNILGQAQEVMIKAKLAMMAKQFN